METCMEVVIDRDAFLRGLQLVQNIVEPRQTLPILANVLLEADTETVRVTATDLEVGARVAIPAKVATKGAITVSARKLAEIVKELPAAPVALKVTDNASVSLRCAGATYKLVGLSPDDFPPVVPASPASWVALDAKTLRELLAQTSFAISHDETRYALNGILFVLQGKDVQMVATDGHRLAMSKRSLGRDVGAMTGIVPRKAVIEIMRVLGAGEDVQIAITENQFVLQMPNFVMTARLIEGQFPNYEAVIPKAHPGRLVVARSAFAAALRRMAVMAEERNKPVKLTLAPAALRLSASSQDLGEAEETLEVGYSGAEVVIGFNARYLLDAISAVDRDQIFLEVKDALSPGVIKSVEDEGYCCVIMPMRI
jgi:DNA polymerase III subunit beta